MLQLAPLLDAENVLDVSDDSLQDKESDSFCSFLP